MRTFREEKKLQKEGYLNIIGVDEAGRGPLAGPVVAVAVRVDISKIQKLKLKIKKLIQDSKKLTSKNREKIFRILINNPSIEWGKGKVSEKVIDKINIFEASKLAMKRAVKNLEKKLNKKFSIYGQGKSILIIDGNFKIDLKIPQKSIIKADEKVFSCQISSILAKVWRDRIMEKYHKKYPQYGFNKHKGYPTKFHLKMLKKYKACEIHRKSFKPVNKNFQFSNSKLNSKFQ
jgi:ribonuclease HII